MSDKPTFIPSTEQLLAQALDRITQLMEKQTAIQELAAASAPRRRKTLGEYLKERPRKRLHRPVFQNGQPVNPAGLSQETIDKLDTLATGEWCEETGAPILVKRFGKNALSTISIQYSNKGEANRPILYSNYPTFTKMVNAILDDMALKGVEPVIEARPPREEPEIPQDLSAPVALQQ